METSTFYVSLSMQDAAAAIDNEIIRGNVSGTLIDRFVANHPDGTHCLISVYEKHFVRAGNRLTLTVTLDNIPVFTQPAVAAAVCSESTLVQLLPLRKVLFAHCRLS